MLPPIHPNGPPPQQQQPAVQAETMGQQQNWGQQVAGHIPAAPQAAMQPEQPQPLSQQRIPAEMMHQQPYQTFQPPQDDYYGAGYEFRHDGYHNNWGQGYDNAHGNGFRGAPP